MAEVEPGGGTGARVLSDLVYRLRALFRRGAVERELDDELRFHVEQQAAKHVRSGLSPDQARRLAGGGVSQVAEIGRASCRERVLCVV